MLGFLQRCGEQLRAVARAVVCPPRPDADAGRAPDRSKFATGSFTIANRPAHRTTRRGPALHPTMGGTSHQLPPRHSTFHRWTDPRALPDAAASAPRSGTWTESQTLGLSM